MGNAKKGWFFMFLIGVLFIAIGIHSYFKDTELKRNGIRIPATIAMTDDDFKIYPNTLWVDYEYNGQSYHHIECNTYGDAYSVSEGQIINVLILPDKPNRCYLEATKTNYPLSLLGGIFICIYTSIKYILIAAREYN